VGRKNLPIRQVFRCLKMFLKINLLCYNIIITENNLLLKILMPEEKNIEKIDVNIERSPHPDEQLVQEQEKKTEHPENLEKALENLEGQEVKDEGELGMGKTIVSHSNTQLKSEERAKKIEKILENEMDSIYLGLNDIKKKEFKVVGEQTAKQINTLIETGKATAKKVIELIKKWLSVVPGINKFFLEQEAKIKADEILNFDK